MFDKKTIGIGLVVIIAIATSSLVFKPTIKVEVPAQTNLGATPNLDDVDSPFVKISGHQWYINRIPMNATSSVLCSIQNPLGATSTIEFVGAEVTNRGTLTQANNLVISTSTSQWATSSPSLVFDHAIGTVPFSVAWRPNSATSTFSAANVASAPSGVAPGMTTSGASAYVLGPSEWVVWNIATTSPGNGGSFLTYMTGYCPVNLKKI